VRQRVLIVQPYLPDYRRPFFDRVVDRLGDDGVDVELVVGRAAGRQASRSDEAELPGYAGSVRTWRVGVGSRSVRWKRVPVRHADLVVSELGSGVVENYPIALRHPARFAAFGHGYPAVTAPNRLDGALERWQMRRARHLFAYTDAGGAAMIRAGVDERRVTVVRNTIDVAALEGHVGAVDDSVRAAQRERLGIDVAAPVALFIGGLDDSKRPEMLLGVAELVAARLPGFVLVVAGDGTARPVIERRAGEVPWLRYVGRADEPTKAALASVASLLLNPGRVGLLAVDSFVLGLPVVTTEWPFHAPEFEYLEHGRTAVVAQDDLESVAAAVVGLFSDRQRLATMAAACRAERVAYRLDDMVERFCDGVVRALSA
jgi:glycosyltransferase involved in cell wall biosynthesis